MHTSQVKINILSVCDLFYKRLLYYILVFVFTSHSHFGQQSYTFTSCGASGSSGPTQTQVNTSYSGTSLSNSVTVSNGIQTFTIPYTGNFRIEAYGAQGGSSNYPGGLGTKMAGDFFFAAGTVLKIIVGQKGTDGLPLYNSDAQQGGGTGGGGTFVSTLSNSAIIVAGGGGGSSQQGTGGGVNATGTSGTVGINGIDGGGVSGSGGINGLGGLSCNWVGWHGGTGGGGFTGNGVNTSAGLSTFGSVNGPGTSFINGGTGGIGGTSGRDGGFGGGGSSGFSGAGGGGYSGGGAGTVNSSIGGGGGGSFNGGTNQVNVSAANSGDGKVIFLPLCYIELSYSANNGTLAAICSGNSLTLSTNAVSNYSWSNGVTSTSIVVSPTVTQTYSVVGTSSANCTTSAAITITVHNSLPVLTISNPNYSVCLGRTVSLSASGALSYTWNGGITNGVAFTPTSTSYYGVSGQNGCGISSAITSITVTPITVQAYGSHSLICAGSTSSTLSVSSPVGTYTWQPVNLLGQSVVVSPTANTIYTVTASNGTCIGSTTVAVATKPTPTITAAASSTIGCAQSVFTLTASGGATYSWAPGNMTGTLVTVTPSISMAYQVTGSNTVGCSSSAYVLILTKPIPTLNVNASNSVVCSGGAVTLSAHGASNYNWIGFASDSVITVNPFTTSIYSVVGTDTNGCSNTKTITVLVFNPSVTVSASSPSICSGKQTVLTAAGANTYTWSNNLGASPSITVTPLISYIYTVSAYTSSSSLSCLSTDTIAITVFNNPDIGIVASKTLMCKKDPLAILTATGGLTYLWNNNNYTTSTLSALSATPNITTYSVTGTDANGCVNTASIDIHVIECTGIGDLSLVAHDFFIFPNPNNGTFTITGDKTIQLNLINELGQSIRVFQLSEVTNFKADISDLAEGIYFVIGENNGKHIHQKIIVSRYTD